MSTRAPHHPFALPTRRALGRGDPNASRVHAFPLGSQGCPSVPGKVQPMPTVYGGQRNNARRMRPHRGQATRSIGPLTVGAHLILPHGLGPRCTKEKNRPSVPCGRRSGRGDAADRAHRGISPGTQHWPRRTELATRGLMAEHPRIFPSRSSLERVILVVWIRPEPAPREGP